MFSSLYRRLSWLSSQSLFEPVDPQRGCLRLWVGLLLSLSVSCYFGGVTLFYVFSHDYIVQDDARQHVVWLQRFVDPQVFTDDWIAEYFTSVAPIGYQSLYWLGAKAGIAPLLLAKLLPLFLSLITTAYLYWVSLQLLPLPLNGILSTLILNQQLWLNDDLVSATPRAFVYPIFAAFLYYLLRPSLIPGLFAIGLQGLFFPQLVLVQMVILGLRLFTKSRNSWQLSHNRQAYLFSGGGVCVAALVLLPFVLNVSEFGPVVTAAQMQAMPEYGLAGRNQYFGVNPFQFWLLGDSGLRVPLFPSLILAGFGLPFLRRSALPLTNRITAAVKILAQVLLASLIVYGLAHLLLLKLHFPSRYTYHTLRIVLALAAGIVLTVLLEAGWQRLQARRSRFCWRDRTALAAIALLMAVVILVPAIPQLLIQFQGWHRGEAAEVYQYLQTQPPSIRIASLAPEANNLPALTQKSVLVGREFAIPHHQGYYRQFQQRTLDVLRAHYSSNIADLIEVIKTYQIDFFLIEPSVFRSTYLQQDWFIHSLLQESVAEIIHRLEQGQVPALSRLAEQCTVVSAELRLLAAECLSRASSVSTNSELKNPGD